jgi:HTH-type transcriptional regulator/antitoxin HigA
MTALLANLETHWTPIAPLFSLRNEEEYDAAIERLNALVDVVGTNQQHPLYGLLDALGTIVHSYEAEHHSIGGATGPEVLQFLMEEHGLDSTEVPELGPPQAVEQYLAGREDLTIDQARALARRFHVSPAAFI